MDRQRIAVPYAGGLAETEAPSGAKVLWAHAPIGTETDPRDMITAPCGSRAQSLVPSVFRPVLDPSTDGRMVVVVNDATRPTPTGLALEALRSRGLLPETAVKSGRVEILVATGSHARGTDSDLEQILGSANMEALSAAVRWHDGHDAAAHVYLGKTQRGTPVWVDRAVVTAHSLVLINSVEPHYFAGYTGGRKSIVPGVARFATIEANHRFALDPAADILALAGNPVHEDLEEAVAMLQARPLLSIQLVLDGAQVATAAFAGGLHETFASAVDAAARAFVVDIPHRFDIVVTTAAPPMDYDLYQSQKALENAAQAVRPGGASYSSVVVVTVSADALFRPVGRSRKSGRGTPGGARVVPARLPQGGAPRLARPAVQITCRHGTPAARITNRLSRALPHPRRGIGRSPS